MPLLAWAILREPEVGQGKFDLGRFQGCLDKAFTSRAEGMVLGLSDECKVSSDPSIDAKQAHGKSQSFCSHSQGASFALWDPVLRKPLCMSQDSSDIEQRVLYPLGDMRSACPGHKNAQEQTWSTPYVKFRNEPVPLILCISALQVLRGEVPPLRFEDRVVVIGTSYEDSRDFHVTPLGRMPGAVWMMNAIQALMQYGQIEEFHGWRKELLVLVEIVAVAMAFAWFTSLAGALASAVLIVMFLVPLSLWLFQFGTWLDFAVPLLGVAGHHFFSDLMDERFALLRDEHGQ